MATTQVNNGDWYFAGNLTAKTMTLPASTVTNNAIQAAAGISASKLQHRHQPTYSQPNTTATSETRVLHEVYGATAQVIGFRAGSIVAAIGGATVTVDLKKNGTTILSAVITLDNANTAYVSEAGTVTSPNLVAGDVLTVVIVATAGGGTIPTGFFCQALIDEDAQ